MKKIHGASFLAVLTLLFIPTFHRDAAAMFGGGYVLTNAYGGLKTVLIDSAGKVAFTWDHSALTYKQGGYSCYLLQSGNLLRSAIIPEGKVTTEMAPRQGIIQEIDKTGKLVWEYVLANDTFMLHHDMKPMPNGHVLAVSFVVETKAQMIAAGVDTNLIKSMANPKFMLAEKIIEIDPRAAGGPKIVWEWKMFDHTISGDSAKAHPERISGTITTALWGQYKQWVHLNGLDYNPKFDLICFSSRLFSELFIIDHNLTTEQAAGHTGGARGKGGDILYRWGKPGNYKATGGTTINILHGVNWIPESYQGGGDIIFFHNGASVSQVVEIKTPVESDGAFPPLTSGQATTPAQPTWVFAPTSDFFSPSMSCAFRLPNGNTLALVSYPSSGGGMNVTGNSTLVEIDKNKQVLSTTPLELKGEAVEAKNTQKYNPAKIMFYEKDYAGIKSLFGQSGARGIGASGAFSSSSPLIRTDRASGRLEFRNVAGCEINLFTMQGKKVYSSGSRSASVSIETAGFPRGVFCARISRDNATLVNHTINILSK
jgi:hypothetical protein